MQRSRAAGTARACLQEIARLVVGVALRDCLLQLICSARQHRADRDQQGGAAIGAWAPLRRAEAVAVERRGGSFRGPRPGGQCMPEQLAPTCMRLPSDGYTAALQQAPGARGAAGGCGGCARRGMPPPPLLTLLHVKLLGDAPHGVPGCHHISLAQGFIGEGRRAWVGPRAGQPQGVLEAGGRAGVRARGGAQRGGARPPRHAMHALRAPSQQEGGGPRGAWRADVGV